MANRLKWVWQQADWPAWRFDAATLAAALASARKAQGEAVGRAQLLTSSLDTRAQAELLVLEGFNTSAIEGEQLNVEALRSSIARRLGIPLESNKAGPTPRAVEGLIDVLQDATRNYEKPLALDQLNAWQSALFPTGRSGLYQIRVGQLRGDAPMRIVSSPHQRERLHYEAPPRDGLEAQVQTFLDWFNGKSFELDGLVRAGLAHLWFEVLHPYEDGNGRVGRALLDKALAQDEKRPVRLYSLSAQLYSERQEYYAALERASRGDLDATDWLTFFFRQVEAAAKASETAIGKVLDKARFWVAHGAQPMNDRQRKVVNLLLDKGRGGFEGGMTNGKYVSIAKTSPATAQRDLADLVQKQILALVGAGRSARYDIQWDAPTNDATSV
ncbi:Fic family protein [Steroidobacter flavus]|uniref:Fic family protein n=1 Tax=Steroidobacter flavus TaxID=1842136 RepID=A0ABV8STZ2_9GAMM